MYVYIQADNDLMAICMCAYVNICQNANNGKFNTSDRPMACMKKGNVLVMHICTRARG